MQTVSNAVVLPGIAKSMTPTLPAADNEDGDDAAAVITSARISSIADDSFSG